jgi:hypothetical protein
VLLHAEAVPEVTVSGGEKTFAVLVGLGLLVLVWAYTWVRTGDWRAWKLAEGADKKLSTSKFQWFLWLFPVLFAYLVLWIIRAFGGEYAAITDVPANLMVVIGLSTGTALAAKGITVGYVDTGRIDKPSDGANQPGGLLTDDSGFPELAKIQMMGFTFIAVGIFIATLIHQLRGNPVNTELPDIDTSLLVLMGLSQGGYVGKKLVSVTTPVLYAPVPPEAAPGAEVTLNGASLGSAQGTSRLLLDGQDIPATTWSETSIKFSVPAAHPSGAWPQGPVHLVVDVGGGRRSNDVVLAVTPPIP